MQTQNPVKFGDCLGKLAGTVGPGDDELGLGAIEMRAPVSYDTVAAVWAIALPAIADN
jgi:hypothetical protein